MIPTNISQFRIEATKIAKKHEISMYMCSEKKIEIAEEDDNKRMIFIKAIKKLNSETKVTDLILNNQFEDTKGNSIKGSKSLYLVDDNYYKKLIGGDFKVNKESQISMFE